LEHIQGALYFPLISPPVSEWLTRALLYWDTVGTIVPEGWIEQPERLGPHTLELVQRELLVQVFPYEVKSGHWTQFETWLHSLDEPELEARRRRFAAGEFVHVHKDKWLAMGSALREAQDLQLARYEHENEPGWIEVEPATANEFMASLALGLCHPDSGLCRYGSAGVAWVPSTGESAALDGLLAGLTPAATESRADRKLRLRVQGEIELCELRTTFLEEALPIPAQPPSVQQIEAFRRKHGDLLPRARRRVEALVDAVSENKETLQERQLSREAQEIEELLTQAEAYLGEAGLRRTRRSPLLRIAKAVPGASAPVGAVLETAASLEKGAAIEQEPLAYFAFARVELKLDARWTPDVPHPLVQTFAA
jgi:hypothetical protein